MSVCFIFFGGGLENSETPISNDSTVNIKVFSFPEHSFVHVFFMFVQVCVSDAIFLPICSICGAILGPWGIHVGALGRFVVEQMQSNKIPQQSAKKSDARAASVCGSGERGSLIIN